MADTLIESPFLDVEEPAVMLHLDVGEVAELRDLLIVLQHMAAVSKDTEATAQRYRDLLESAMSAARP